MKGEEETKFDTLSRRLKEVAEGYNKLKEVGIHEDILIAFIKDKTGMSKKDINKMLKATDNFYEMLTQKVVEEQI